MRSLFIQDDGRLRTGRVSLLLFFGLLLSLSLLFRLRQPVDKAVVVVRHIFTAPSPERNLRPEKTTARVNKEPRTAEAKKTVPPEARLRTAESNEQRSVSPPTPAPLSQPRRELTRMEAAASREPENSPAPALAAAQATETPRPRVESKPEVTPQVRQGEHKVVAAVSSKSQTAAASRDSPVPVPVSTATAPESVTASEPPAQESAALTSGLAAKQNTPRGHQSRDSAPPAAASGAGKEALSSPPPAASRTDLRAAEITAAVVSVAPAARPRVVFKPLPEGILRAERSPKTASKSAAPRLLDEEVVEDLQQRWSEKVSAASAVAPVLMSAAVRRQLLTGLEPVAAGDEERSRKNGSSTAKSVSRESRPAAVAGEPQPTQNPRVRKRVPQGTPPAITVARERYNELHRAWCHAGRDDKHPDRLIPLRIENLRQAYSYLQMKPVVIRPDGSCIDLSDGRHLPPAFLDRFSEIVIRVSKPWEKWGAELARAGLRPGEKFEVRYYLYDFVRRALYARVNQAYDWARQRGLLGAATRPDEVDVLGRAYVVNRSGGGAFGVFVPRQLTTSAGRVVKISPEAFGSAPEVAALRQAGLI